MGGTAAMVKNLEKLMIEEGITIRKNTEITKINLSSSKKSIKNIEIIIKRHYQPIFIFQIWIQVF